MLLATGGLQPAAAQGDFRWSGRVANVKVIEIKGINGSTRTTLPPRCYYAAHLIRDQESWP